MIGRVCGPISQLDPVADRRVARPPDPDDPAVLDPDVGLDAPSDGSSTSAPATTASSSESVGRAAWVIRGRSVLA